MNKLRILVFGAAGMLGQKTVEFFVKNSANLVLASGMEKDYPIFGIDYQKCDITKRDEVKKITSGFLPDIIVNCAAFTNVDLCETEREMAWRVNVSAVEYISEAARTLDAHFIHISTDYVFDGIKGQYIESDIPKPLGYYGRTKLASENALRISGSINTILRTNVLYGFVPGSRPDFVRWLVKSLREGTPVRIVTDQINNPNYIDDLVQAISKVAEFRKTGLYHIGGKEFLSRYDFTMRIIDFFGLDKSLVTPLLTEDLKQPAKRPLNSGLITLKAESELGYKPHTLEETLASMKKLIDKE